MGYTPFKMRGPSLYSSPAKDDEQAKARENVKAMDKESDKLKTGVLEARERTLPSTESRYFKDGQDENIEAIIENTPKKRYTEEQKEYLRDKDKNKKNKSEISQEQQEKNKKALETHKTRLEKRKNKKDNKGGIDRYNAVITKSDPNKVDDRDKWKPWKADWMK